MKLQKNSVGFTLFEALVVLAIIGILAMATLPSAQSWITRERLIAVAEMVASDLQWARSESIKRNLPVTITFTSGSNWSYALNSTTAVVLPIDCPAPVSAIKVICSSQNTDFNGISLAQQFVDNDMKFDNVRGITDESGAITLSSGAKSLKVQLSTLGRVHICSPTNKVAGYPDC